MRDKRLFVVVLIVFSVVHKGVLYLLSKVAIHLSENFLLKTVVAGLEFILIAYTVLFCAKEGKENKVIRYIGFTFSGILMIIALIGVFHYYGMLK